MMLRIIVLCMVIAGGCATEAPKTDVSTSAAICLHCDPGDGGNAVVLQNVCTRQQAAYQVGDSTYEERWDSCVAISGHLTDCWIRVHLAPDVIWLLECVFDDYSMSQQPQSCDADIVDE